MKLHSYDPKKAVKKGAAEGSTAGGLALVLGLLMRAVRAKNPDLPWSVTEDVAVVSVGVGFFAGIARWFRNRRKHNGI